MPTYPLGSLLFRATFIIMFRVAFVNVVMFLSTLLQAWQLPFCGVLVGILVIISSKCFFQVCELLLRMLTVMVMLFRLGIALFVLLVLVFVLRWFG